MEKHVFISYNKNDSHVAEKIATTLKAQNIRYWIASEHLAPADLWLKAMLDEVEKSHVVILVFSSNTSNARWVKDEITLALNKQIPIIPFCIENVPFHDEFRSVEMRFQRLDAFPPPFEVHFEKLLAAVGKHLGVNSAPSHPLPHGSSINPFTETGAIQVPARFIERQAEMFRLMTLLNSGGSVSLQGVRKIGKSSLLRCLARSWEGDVLGPLDCQSMIDQDDFYQSIASELKLDKSDRKYIRDVLNKRRLLFLLDELDFAPKFGITHDHMALFRALLNSNRDFKIVAISRRPLKENSAQYSPLFNLLLPFTLGPLKESEARQLLDHPWAPEATLFDTNTCKMLIALAGCHPYKLQRAAHHCFEYLADSTYNWEEEYEQEVEQML